MIRKEMEQIIKRRWRSSAIRLAAPLPPSQLLFGAFVLGIHCAFTLLLTERSVKKNDGAKEQLLFLSANFFAYFEYGSKRDGVGLIFITCAWKTQVFHVPFLCKKTFFICTRLEKRDFSSNFAVNTIS
ncbi:MAG: hypothetical protein LBS03_04225 [Bacteroidales bacterium]|jgi:hypothetical protein|nr:hypothetical protein [Bacteroidales bacterium]